MRAKGTSDQLAVRRQHGLKLLRAGKSTAQIAEQLGVTARTVRRWRQDAKSPKPRQPLGRPQRLTAHQRQQLEQALKRGAYTHGYAEEYWTLDRITHVIWQQFGIR